MYDCYKIYEDGYVSFGQYIMIDCPSQLRRLLTLSVRCFQSLMESSYHLN